MHLRQVLWAKVPRLAPIFIIGLVLSWVWIVAAFGSSPGAGSLDTSFNHTGIVTTSVNSLIDSAFAVAIQPDGKIVTVGACDDIEDFAVIRYNPDGSLDTSFNGTGIVTTSVGNGYEEFATSIVLQADRKIVVAGAGTRSGQSNDFALARYNPDGSLDTDFNSTGVITTHISANSRADSLALQPDGKLVAAGTAYGEWVPNSVIAVARYNQDGSLDTSFKGTGIVTTSIGVSGNGSAVLVQPDGKIVVAGKNASQFVVVRYTATGDLDPGFNGAGVVTTSVGSASGGAAAVLQPDGKIVVVGWSGSGEFKDFAVVRYNGDGTLDTTFNTTGVVTTDISSRSDDAYAVALQSFHKIVVAGVGDLDSVAGRGDFALVRYNEDGSLDTAFGEGGIITTTLSGNRDEARGIGIQPDGKIVAAGFENEGGLAGTDVNFALVRYLGDSFTYMPVVLKK